MKKSLDKSGVVGTMLMDLSKAYDFLPHDLLIAKLGAYRFGISNLCQVYDYLTNIHQRAKLPPLKATHKKCL